MICSGLGVRLIGAVLVVCAAAGHVRADSPWLYGIHWYGTDGDVESLTGGKGVWVLENVNTTGGPSAAGQLGKFETAVARGHTLIVRLQPAWGLAVPSDAQMPEYLNQVRAVAGLLKNVCRIWQIGNEMDNFQVENQGVYLSPADYVRRFKQIRTAIKSVTSPLGEQMVLLGPTTAFADFYLSSMLNALGVTDVDGFAIHCYGLDPDPTIINSLNNFRAAYVQQLALIDERGFRYKPVFITEFDRCTNPSNSSTQEPVSSQFLHLAYQQLNQWNSTPGNHPITGAVWFIYPDDSNWSCFSLRHHKIGPRGRDVNLWDAFQHAAGLSYAAGIMSPALHVSPAAILKEAAWQSEASDGILTVTNIGAGGMDYQISCDSPWLTVDPPSGRSAGEADPIRLRFHAAHLPSAVHTATITVSAVEAIGSPIQVPVQLEVLPAPGDMDRDGDVDQEDFGRFQVCLNGPGRIQADPECRFARLDSDVDVDQDDLDFFLGCLRGAGVPADPACGLAP